MKTGILLLNLGTPAAPTTPAVRAYLREFLADGRVIDIPAIPRWMLVNLVIAPFRAPKSAHAYQSVWTAEGSPLMVHSRALQAALAARTGLPVELAMRYGRPTVGEALDRLDVDRLRVVPLYPQYASATTGTALEALYAALGPRQKQPAIDVVPPLVASPAWMDALVEVTRPHVQGVDHVLLSFHGLPERQITRTNSTCRLDEGCCHTQANLGFCYRAHCLWTARTLAERLALPAWTATFQSRLGRDRWLEPSTTNVVDSLARDGVKKVAVVAPSFVSDCLETLEELGMRLKEQFLAGGGESLVVAPCLNADPRWVDALARIVTDR